jgi:transcriptional regulator with XRE-family HTH domain
MSDRMHVGCLIRDLRLALGLSQSQLAEKLCCLGAATITRNKVSRWESGAVRPSSYWLSRLATALEVPLTVLEDADVDRRGFLTSVAGTAIAPVVAADLISHGFAAALDGAAPDVDQWRATVAQYGHDYMSAGAAEIQRRLASDLVVLQQQLDRPEMWGIAAKLMTLYGKTIPGSDGAKAIYWYRLASTAADRSGDTNARVWVRGRAAIALGYEGASLPMADTFAADALEIDERPSLGRLNAAMGKAHSAALRGDRDGAYQLLTEGRRTFDVAGSYDETSDYSVPEWRMHVFVSLLAARLGDEKTALEAQDAAAKLLPDSLPRFRTHLELHRGLMLAKAGDVDGGIAYGRRALEALPPDKHSLTLRLLMREIEHTAA